MGIRRQGRWLIGLGLACGALAAVPPGARAGWVEDCPEGTVIHLKLWSMPNPAAIDTPSKAEQAVLDEFVRRFPSIFAERHRSRCEADPRAYGRHDWSRVSIELHPFTGITIEGQAMDSRVLMAIAGGMAPDVLYVNFRQSDTFIQQGFLYPLDSPEDLYLSSLSDAERRARIHEKIWPVIRRRGPDGATRVWALPTGGVLGKVMLYRKDLLDAAGIPYPRNDWTWDDLMAICRRVADPGRGLYGISISRGASESWHWVNYLWSAGGEVLEYDEPADQWRAVFNSPAGVAALEFYTRLWAEVWQDRGGRRRYGYVNADSGGRGGSWALGQVAFCSSYIDDQSLAEINPELVGMVPMPAGPGGHRGSELNARMQGLFAGIRDRAVRDAAWEYLRFYDSREAVALRTRVMVEGGMGRFVNPDTLHACGYADIVRLAPREWAECHALAIDMGRPEPYGRNCQLVYYLLTKPLEQARQLIYDGRWPEDPAERRAVLKGLLDETARAVDEQMIGRISPRARRVRRAAAIVLLAAIAAAFAAVFRVIARALAPPATEPDARAGAWGFRRYARAYWLLAPALLSIFLWQYVPLLMGSKLAFQDYRIMGGTRWIGVDNFGDVLWDADWWRAVWNSCRYSLLSIALTFLPPVLLAVLLQEIPRGRLVFRFLFYLPAVISGLVVIYLWKSFYEPSEFGVLNAIALRIPALGFLLLGAVLFLVLWNFTRRLARHRGGPLRRVLFAGGGP